MLKKVFWILFGIDLLWCLLAFLDGTDKAFAGFAIINLPIGGVVGGLLQHFFALDEGPLMMITFLSNLPFWWALYLATKYLDAKPSDSTTPPNNR